MHSYMPKLSAAEIEMLKTRRFRAVNGGETVTPKRIETVLTHLEEGLTLTQTAQRHGVSRRTVANWLAAYRAKGGAGLEAGETRGRKSMLDEATREEMKTAIERGRLGSERAAWAWLRKRCGEKVKRATARYWYEKLSPESPRVGRWRQHKISP
jgi:transposase